MGRPINKKYLGSGAGKIQVTSYRLVGGTETTTTQDSLAYIVSQRSTRKFKVRVDAVADSAASDVVLTLVDKAAGALGEGEFRISVVNPLDSSVDNASKITNRTVVVGGIGADATAGSNKFKSSIADGNNTQGGAAIGDEAFDASSVAALGIANIDSQ